MRNKCLLLILACVLLGMQTAHAQLLFSLNPAGQTGMPGTTLTFNATLINAGASVVFLNGASTIVPGAGLFLDPNPFFNNFPLSLASGESFTKDIFSVSLDPAVLPGDYTGSFTIIGGSDSSALDDLATQNFLVSVQANHTMVPGRAPLLASLQCLV